MQNEIIVPEEVLWSLFNGYEVLHIKIDQTNKYGMHCKPLTREVFEEIEIIVRDSGKNDIFIKLGKEEVEEDQNDEE